MKKLLTILLVLISFSTFAQFEAGEYINSDTVKIDGVPLLLNTFKQGNLGGASNIFYSTGASSQPASGSLNQVIGGNSLSANYVPMWYGNKLANSNIYQDVSGNVGINKTDPTEKLDVLGTFKLSGNIVQDGVANGKGIQMRIGSKNRWIIGYEGDESGGNLGTDMYYYRYDDNGDYLGLAMILKRGNGNVGIGTTSPLSKLSINGGLHVGGDSDAGDDNILADGTITGTQLISNIATGTPPLVVASSTKVDSLNVGLLDGKKASDFQLNSDTLTFDATLSDLADSSAAIRALANTKAVVSGTDNYIMKKTGDNTLGNSSLIDNGSTVSTSLPFSSTISLSAPTHFAGSSYWNSNFFELGYGQIGNRYAVIDLTGDDTYTDYGLRLIRGNTGADAISQISHRGKGAFYVGAQDAASVYFTTKNTIAVTIDTLQRTGFGTLTPAAQIHSQSTGTQARLGYDANKYTDLSTGSTGNLTIDPTGDTVKVVGAVNSTGGFFKNGVEITGGSGGGISNIGITVPTGLTVSPDAITSNDTFAISLQSGYSIPTTANQTNWTEGYNNQISTVAFSGSTTKQITLTQKDGGQIFGYFTDLTASDWVTDTYGIKYNAGKVCIGTATSPSFSAELTVGNGSNTTHAISASSLDKSAVFATSSSGFGVNAQSGYRAISGAGTGSGIGVYGTSSTGFGGFFEGLGCKATKYYVSSLNTAPASSTATGTTGEIRFTSDYIYVCVATNTWKRTQISTW